MADDFTELFVKWTLHANARVAQEWLEQRGFSVSAMKTGLMILGTKSQIEKALSVSLESIKAPGDLPVPAELKEHVASITLPTPRSYH